MTVDLELELQPLVALGRDLTTAEVERYSRHVLLPNLGRDGQRRLANARVAVVGAGGLGSPVLTYLAAAGVGTIGIIDFDQVEASNLQRQTIHGVADIGRLKTASATDALARINPLIGVVQHPVRLESLNALDLLAGYDLVIDGTDNFATRYLVNDACVLLNLPYVWGSVFQFEGQVSVFWAAHGPHYREVFPTPPPPGSVPSCGEGGVLGVLCGAVGAVMATEAVKLICGIGRPLIGRMLVYDALAMSFRTIRVRKDPAAALITGLVDYAALCGTAGANQGGADESRPSGSRLLSPAQLSGILSAGPQITLVDVREPAEFALGAIENARPIPLPDIISGVAINSLRQACADQLIVVYCKSGARSARAATSLRAAGFERVAELRGGILAWAADVDPSLPRY